MRLPSVAIAFAALALAQPAAAESPVRTPVARPPAMKVVAPRAATAPRVAAPRPTAARVGEAVDFAKRLAPSPGFAYSLDDYAKLDPPTRAVLETFGRARNYVERVAGERGFGKPVLAHNPEVEPEKLGEALDAALEPHGLRASDAAKLLRKAAGSRELGDLMKEALRTSADAWAQKTEHAGWQMAITLKPPRPAKQPPVLHAKSLYQQNLEARAQGEWDRAPRAVGWNADHRELVVYPAEDGRPDQLRAFTYEQWMAYRVPELRAGDEHRHYIDTTFGAARHY